MYVTIQVGELLPRLSILTLAGGLFLLHFPGGYPRLTLSAIRPWKPGLSSPYYLSAPYGATVQRTYRDIIARDLAFVKQSTANKAEVLTLNADFDISRARGDLALTARVGFGHVLLSRMGINNEYLVRQQASLDVARAGCDKNFCGIASIESDVTRAPHDGKATRGDHTYKIDISRITVRRRILASHARQNRLTRADFDIDVCRAIGADHHNPTRGNAEIERACGHVLQADITGARFDPDLPRGRGKAVYVARGNGCVYSFKMKFT